MHPRCIASISSRRVDLNRGIAIESGSEYPWPTLEEIFRCNVLTKEFLPASLLPLAREEYGKLLAQVIRTNRSDAWEMDSDTVAKKQARLACLQLFIFGKSVLRQSTRGQRPAQSYHFTRSLLERWRAGDRYGLWLEAVACSERRIRGKRGKASQAQLHREIERLVSLGRAGEAAQRLVSPGLASNTPAVKARKFLLKPFTLPSIPYAGGPDQGQTELGLTFCASC